MLTPTLRTKTATAKFTLMAAISTVALSLAAFSLPAHAEGDTMMSQDASLYHGLGEKAGIRKFTHTFVGIIVADERIKDKFADADMDRLEGLLSDQFCELSGGPCKYAGRDMKTTHKNMGIMTAQFNALAEDLQIAMEQAGVSTFYSNQLVGKLAPMYHVIVTK